MSNIISKLSNRFCALFLIFCGYLTAFSIVLIDAIKNIDHHNEQHEIQTTKCNFDDNDDRWQLFVEALIYVESRGNDLALGKNNDAGCLQITPVYVAAANGIIGRKAYYTLDDRFNCEKSIEMFNVVNAYHNPDRDIEKAIRLHNPGAGVDYKNKILTKLEELINETP